MVSFDSYDMTVRQLLDMYNQGAIFVPPEYQRQFVWDEERESELIESIFLGIPIPNLFMATNLDSTWEVVDGVQRLSTLVHYVQPSDRRLAAIARKTPLKLTSLEKLTELKGTTYDDLPSSLQLLFQTRPLRLTVLNDKSDLNVRFDLFERLNTGGILLSDQEIRNCVYRGPFNDQLKNLAKSSSFRTAVLLKDSDQKNGMAEEYVLRFFAYAYGRSEFDHSVRGFFNNFMKAHASKKLTAAQLKLFRDTMALLAEVFPNGITRGKAGTTSAVLYEALAVGVSDVLRAKGKISKAKLAALTKDAILNRYTTGATNSRKMLINRISHVANSIV